MTNLVPTFSLYGEVQTAVNREYLHIEEISARSAARNWQIDTHTHEGLLQLLFVFSGSARVSLDGSEQDYDAPLAVVIPPGVIHAFKFMPQTEGYVLTLDSHGLAGQSEGGSPLFSVHQGEADVIALDTEGPTGASRIRGLLAQIEDEFRAPGAASTRMQVWLVRALLLLVVRARIQREKAEDANTAEPLAAFRQLLEAHFAEHWPVSRYADQLSLTESRLNRLCLKGSGKTAFNLIQERVLLEARRKLVYTGAPISQIAYELGFSDPPYFCRFFKKLTRQTPGDFRAGRPE
jgi:AraC family transcriptional activator of pobA